MNRATNNIQSHPSKIMMNTGVDSWLGAYNGVPANAYYDWTSYDPQ